MGIPEWFDFDTWNENSWNPKYWFATYVPCEAGSKKIAGSKKNSWIRPICNKETYLFAQEQHHNAANTGEDFNDGKCNCELRPFWLFVKGCSVFKGNHGDCPDQ